MTDKAAEAVVGLKKAATEQERSEDLDQYGEFAGLRVERLGVDRGGQRVIADLSFDLDPGRALLLTGPNGAGKTTLIRALAGLLPTSEGVVRMAGAMADFRVSEECHYVGHTNAAKPELTVAENLRFWAVFLAGGAVAPAHVDEVVATALARLGLMALEDIPVRYLSAGQQRRVAIARLLLAERPLWLLDEPTSSLDTVNAARLVEIGNEHLANGGMIVAATHLPLGFAPVQELKLMPVEQAYEAIFEAHG